MPKIFLTGITGLVEWSLYRGLLRDMIMKLWLTRSNSVVPPIAGENRRTMQI